MHIYIHIVDSLANFVDLNEAKLLNLKNKIHQTVEVNQEEDKIIEENLLELRPRGINKKVCMYVCMLYMNV